MKKLLLATAALMLVTSQALALGDNIHGSYNTTTTNQGGQGGTGVGIGIGQGGSAKAYGGNAGVFGSGNSHVDNTNLNTNFNSLSSKNDIRNSNSQGQHQGQGQLQGQMQGNIGLGSGNKTEVNVGGDTYEAAAYAPGLAALTGTACMGSTSISGGAVGFSAGIGTTWTDKNCQKIESMKAVGNLPKGATIAGYTQEQILSEMAASLEGVTDAIGVLNARKAAAQQASLPPAPPAKVVPDWCKPGNAQYPKCKN